MSYVTNLDYKTDACKLTRSETCQNTTFTWLEHARQSTKSVTVTVTNLLAQEGVDHHRSHNVGMHVQCISCA